MELEKLDSLDGYKIIHLIGIGGVSMSAIAENLKSWGYKVTGSDITESELTNRLSNDGIEVVIGHSPSLASKADLIIYNAAISDEDPEIVIAKEKNIPYVSRGILVGYLTRKYKEAICVSGTHGKTTTTSMISCCFIDSNLDPSIEVGAILNKINGNYRIGKSEYFILESCEYKANFLNFVPNTAVVLNIDNDHLDYYKTFENIVKTFNQFASRVDEKGCLIVNGDDEKCLKLKEYTKAQFVSYGIQNSDADFVAKNINFDDNGFAEFDCYKNKELYIKVKLSVAGIHNVLNALATIAVCNYYKIQKDVIIKSLNEFTGASRRLEYKGKFKSVSVFDDYAHHPTEIMATAKAVKNKKYENSWVIFQPHTYSRTKEHLRSFAEALTNFDNVIVTDIYAAREKNTFDISSQDLVQEMKKFGKDSKYIKDFHEIAKFIKENVKPNDIVITLGAGTVTDIGSMIVEKN